MAKFMNKKVNLKEDPDIFEVIMKAEEIPDDLKGYLMMARDMMFTSLCLALSTRKSVMNQPTVYGPCDPSIQEEAQELLLNLVGKALPAKGKRIELITQTLNRANVLVFEHCRQLCAGVEAAYREIDPEDLVDFNDITPK